MRNIKLQMQVTADGFAGGPNGELSWMTWEWDNKLKEYAAGLTTSYDTILMGRKMTDGFIAHWKNTLKNPKDPDYDAAKIFIDTPKIVFSRTLAESLWENTVIAKDSPAETIKKLKAKDGKDVMVYGGADFVTSLISENLIDDYYLFVNPTAIGSGLTIFGGVRENLRLKLADSRKFDCGIVLLNYKKS